jgi:hypothetical protein
MKSQDLESRKNFKATNFSDRALYQRGILMYSILKTLLQGSHN